MTISLSDAGKRYNRDWIFRHVTYQLTPGNFYAITGPNGSGKSTLLQAISGSLLLNEGKCDWSLPQFNLTPENIHQGFKPFLPGITTKSIIEILGLEKATHKQIRFYSSGMKQRVKLAQCIFSNSALVLLDEPCTNLDSTGINLYHSLIQQYCTNRLVVVSSNDEVEYGFCTERINMADWK